MTDRTPPSLGEKGRDRVTGFVGVVTGRAEYLEDTPSLRLTATLGPTDDLKERWVAEARVDPADDDPPPAGFHP
jgi:hypothetical protein